MGMGNDGIDVSNSLDTCTQLNNSGIREVNSEKSTNVMQSESIMGNVEESQSIDSPVSGAQENIPNDLTTSANINNVALTPTEDFINEVGSESKTVTSNTTSDNGNEQNEEKSDEAIPPENDLENDSKKNNLKNGCQEENTKTNIESPDTDCQVEPIPTSAYRNECLLRVSYLKRDWGGKRVSEIRTVSELLETFYSLEEPIIMPLPKQRNYYDQWARIPRCDVIQRLYPRANSSVSMKCWTLFQAIQSDQNKSNSGNSPAPSPQKLAPPSNGQVECKSLDSIIDHYNQMLQCPATEDLPKTPPPAAPLRQRSTVYQGRSYSGSSRSSSCNSTRSIQTLKQEGGSLKAPLPRSKISPVPSGRVKTIGPSGDSYSTPPRQVEAPQRSHRAIKSPFPDYELIPNCVSDPVMSHANVFDISAAQNITHTMSSVTSKSHGLRRSEPSCHHHEELREARISPVGGAGHSVTLTKSDRENRETIIISPSHDSNSPERPLGALGGRDSARNPYGINTSILSLSLPYERAQTVAEIQTDSSNIPKSKLSSVREDSSSCKGRLSEKHERFPLRSTAFVSRSRRYNTTLFEFGHNRTRLKSGTRSIPTSSHNIQNLRDSLLIQEINCDSDNNNERHKLETPLKNRNGKKQKAKSLQHECRPMVQLPVTMHSMLDRLSSDGPSLDSLSTDEHRSPSRRNSAVSLASVHFLDLADLKTLLKKSKTTLHYLQKQK